MNIKNKTSKIPGAIAAAALALLSACGGGGGGGSGGGMPLIGIAPAPDAAASPAQTPVAPPASQPSGGDPDTSSPSTLVTSVSAATYGASTEELAAFTALNAQRERCRFGLLSQNAMLDIAATGHTNYLLKNNAAGHFQDETKPFFTGIGQGNRATAAGYLWRIALDDNSDVTGGNANVSTGRGVESIRSLLSAPYHALDLLTAVLDVGISVKSSDEAGTTATFGPRTIAQYNFGLRQTSFAQHPGAEEIQTYPCEGTTGTAFELKNESPNPIPGRDLAVNPIGQPIIVAVRPGQLVEIASATMVKKSNLATIALRPTMTRANDPNNHIDPSRAIILPDVPLEPNTEYTVSIAGTNTTIASFNNGNPVSSGTNPAITSNTTGAFTKTFTFKTGS